MKRSTTLLALAAALALSACGPSPQPVVQQAPPQVIYQQAPAQAPVVVQQHDSGVGTALAAGALSLIHI